MAARSTFAATGPGLAALAIVAVGVAATATVAQGPTPDRYLDIPVGGGPIDVGPVPAGIDAIDARSCAECHAEHYRQWSTSAHRSAFTNAVFESEYRRRPSPFCARCHAPRTNDPISNPVTAAAGVDCAACHVRNGAVINATVSGDAPHASAAVPAIARTDACARCHQFEFQNQPGELMQRTVDEWAASPAARRGQPCQHCHMPSEPGGHGHSFPGGRDSELSSRALDVVARARVVAGRTRVTLDLRARAPGHAVPTGDIFRQLEVRAWPAGAPESAARRMLGQSFRIDRGWHRRSDTRVPPRGRRRVELELPVTRDVHWSIHLWRVRPQDVEEQAFELDEVRHEMATGTVRAL